MPIAKAYWQLSGVLEELDPHSTYLNERYVP